MAELSPAERMLKNSTNAQCLIRQLQALKAAPIPRVGIHLSPDTKANIAAFQGYLQGYIDELTAQREKAVALVKLIPDQIARTVIELRYGLIGSGCELMPYPDVCETLGYENKTIFRYRKKGIDQLNRLLEEEKA